MCCVPGTCTVLGCRCHRLFLALQVHAYLYNKSWDTRIAAAETLGHLAALFPHHSATDLARACAEQHGSSAKPPISSPQPSGTAGALKAFDVQAILEKGTALLASGGQVRVGTGACRARMGCVDVCARGGECTQTPP